MGLKNEETFQKKCRLCGRLGRRFTDIFNPLLSKSETKPNKKLSQLIYKCLQLQVKEDDRLPKKICDDCNKKLTAWQNFYNKCEQTQKKLLQQYLENRQKTSVSLSVCNESEGGRTCSNSSAVMTVSSVSDQISAAKSQALKEVSSLNLTKPNTAVVNKDLKDDKDKTKESVNVVSNVTEKVENGAETTVKVISKIHKKNISRKGQFEDGTVEVKNIGTSDNTECLVVNKQRNENLDVRTVNYSKKVKPPKTSLKTKKTIEVHKCHICEKTFLNRKNLKAHVTTHLSTAEFQCDKCSKKFRSKFSLRSHLETHSSSRNYCCHLCGSLFYTASGLCNHVKLHSEEAKRFTCPLCGKQFRQSGHLEQHQRTHTGERPHQCTECTQRFTTRCQLSRHIQGVHRCAKKHKCVTCGKEFLYSSNYKAHLLRHAGQRDNKCGECGKTFVTTNALFRHRRFHTGDKPFQCDICGKKFADCSNRKRHMLRHLQQPVIPKGRKSGARPKLARINMNSISVGRQNQPSSVAEVVIDPVQGQDNSKVFSQLVQLATDAQTEENTNLNSSQTVQISGEIVQFYSNSGIELGDLPSVYTSPLQEQAPSYSTLISDKSDVFVSLSQEMPQLIQIPFPTQNADFIIEPNAQEVTQFIQEDDKEQQETNEEVTADHLNINKTVKYGKKQRKACKLNSSFTSMTNTKASTQQNADVDTNNFSKRTAHQNQTDNKENEVDRPRIYENLRTFLESSEIVEALSTGRNDDVLDGDNLVNVEFVTLMADDENENGTVSGIQEIIVLPRETRVSDYDLSKNSSNYQMDVTNIVIQNAENNTSEKTKHNDGTMTILKETYSLPQNENCENDLSLIADKSTPGKSGHSSSTCNTNCDNLIEILLSSSDERLSNCIGESENNNNNQAEITESTNLIQVLLESDSNILPEHQERNDLTSRTQQTFFVSSDNFSDEDAIIRMLNSQGTVMLSMTKPDTSEFELSDSAVTEVTHLVEDGCVNESHSTVAASKFKSFLSVKDEVVCETAASNTESNSNIDLMASADYEHEISLTTAITLDNSDVSLMVSKNMSVDELTSRMEATEHNEELATGSMDDIEMFELCTDEDLTKLAPMSQIYQVYQGGKSIKNV